MMNYKAIEKITYRRNRERKQSNQTGSIQRSDSIQHGDE